jgi:hypothetical protein
MRSIQIRSAVTSPLIAIAIALRTSTVSDNAVLRDLFDRWERVWQCTKIGCADGSLDPARLSAWLRRAAYLEFALEGWQTSHILT